MGYNRVWYIKYGISSSTQTAIPPNPQKNATTNNQKAKINHNLYHQNHKFSSIQVAPPPLESPTSVRTQPIRYQTTPCPVILAPHDLLRLHHTLSVFLKWRCLAQKLLIPQFVQKLLALHVTPVELRKLHQLLRRRGHALQRQRQLWVKRVCFLLLGLWGVLVCVVAVYRRLFEFFDHGDLGGGGEEVELSEQGLEFGMLEGEAMVGG